MPPLSSLRWVRDVVDVSIVAILFYHLFLLVRGTRAVQMFLGLIVLLLLSLLAELFQLTALNWLLTSLKTVWVIGFLIIFQPELRKGLSQIGYSKLFHRMLHFEETSRLSEIEDALVFLSRRGVGAILVFERNTSLRPYAETGTVLDAVLSAELLETIFTQPAPLHDGAALIRGNVVVAAGCILPLSQNPALERSLGTRHRAILGISEETDALAIAVSEETRQISIAEGGRLLRNIDPNSLKGILSEFGPGWVVREGSEEAADVPPARSDLSASALDVDRGA